MRHFTYIIAMIGLSYLAGCSQTPQATVAANPPAAAASETFPVIVRIVNRQQTVTVSTGPNSALYSANAADGSVLVSYVTLEELRDEHPQVYERIRPAISNAADGPMIADIGRD